MTLWVRRAIIIVPASRQEEANIKAKLIDTVGGENTFTAGLSPDGEVPATHYICDARAQAIHWQALLDVHGFVPDAFEGQYVDTDPEPAFLYDGLVWTPKAAMDDLSLQPVKTEM